jgi:hypothetical protein
MLISMLKYIKVLRHVSILTDHHQGVGLYLIKVTELFKNTEFKILKINPGVVAAIHVVGVRGAVCWTPTHSTRRITTYTCYMYCCHTLQHTAPQGSPRTPATCIAATTPGLIFRILNSLFF